LDWKLDLDRNGCSVCDGSAYVPIPERSTSPRE
jgi:hypothetical protein